MSTGTLPGRVPGRVPVHQIHWPQASIHLSADAGDEKWQGFDVLQRGAEVYDTGTQQERPSHHRIGEEGFPTSLQMGEHFRIQLIEVRFDLFCRDITNHSLPPRLVCLPPKQGPRTEIDWNITEGRNAQSLGKGLQFRLR